MLGQAIMSCAVLHACQHHLHTRNIAAISTPDALASFHEGNFASESQPPSAQLILQWTCAGDWPLNFDTKISPLLEAGIQVLIYAGVEDFICNWLGNERWVDVLPWSGNGQWQSQPAQSWTPTNSTKAGTVRQLGNLAFVKVNAAVRMCCLRLACMPCLLQRVVNP